MESLDKTTSVPRSAFVTTVAWIAIALAGFGTIISLLQNILFALVLRPDDEPMLQAMAAQLGPTALFIFSHFRLLAALSLVFSALLFVAAVGLLKRRNWARLLFIALLTAGSAWALAIPFLQGTMALSPPADTPDEFSHFFNAFVFAIRVFSALVSVGMCLFFIWLITRLGSAPIRAEFARDAR